MHVHTCTHTHTNKQWICTFAFVQEFVSVHMRVHTPTPTMDMHIFAFVQEFVLSCDVTSLPDLPSTALLLPLGLLQ